MPIRKTPLITGCYYHVFNRSVDKIPIFKTYRCLVRLLEAIKYYRFSQAPFSLCRLIQQSEKEENKIFIDLEKNSPKLVDVICYCIMPNHFHLVLKQAIDKGIQIYLQKTQNSFSKFYNIHKQRKGPVFQNRFRAVLIEDEDQLVHVVRYIHLNPYSSNLIARKNDLIRYPWSSFSEYLGIKKGICEKEIILENFKNRSKYKKFVFDQAEYQRSLNKIKHLLNE